MLGKLDRILQTLLRWFHAYFIIDLEAYAVFGETINGSLHGG